MKFKNEEGAKLFANQQEINKDPYGAGIVSYADSWAKLMEKRLGDSEPGESFPEIAESCSREADTDGITGFMYGAAVSILSSCWIHGEALRRWHNKEYKYEGPGVVNPAIINIG